MKSIKRDERMREELRQRTHTFSLSEVVKSAGKPPSTSGKPKDDTGNSPVVTERSLSGNDLAIIRETEQELSHEAGPPRRNGAPAIPSSK